MTRRPLTILFAVAIALGAFVVPAARRHHSRRGSICLPVGCQRAYRRSRDRDRGSLPVDHDGPVVTETQVVAPDIEVDEGIPWIGASAEAAINAGRASRSQSAEHRASARNGRGSAPTAFQSRTPSSCLRLRWPGGDVRWMVACVEAAATSVVRPGRGPARRRTGPPVQCSGISRRTSLNPNTCGRTSRPVLCCSCGARCGSSRPSVQSHRSSRRPMHASQNRNQVKRPTKRPATSEMPRPGSPNERVVGRQPKAFSIVDAIAHGGRCIHANAAPSACDAGSYSRRTLPTRTSACPSRKGSGAFSEAKSALPWPIAFGVTSHRYVSIKPAWSG